ncbi:DNA methylase N-4/N-6 domain protein [Halothece sp. PCC 7418]|uniref:DNA-methyltransferase n=1 Tax=Halothece sp. (strain PCC 7418) TaxID=65093 RepID=UPI0002A0776B|nr:site-specific DNA-methyltransferase [Halothece sp. PCC 7418]AFZ43773.1 DNA methylase N-4/N-6 domain protein [Halothece sp. PCC 7418]
MKKRAPRNRTLTCSEQEQARLSPCLLSVDSPVSVHDIAGKIINQDFFKTAPYLPQSFIDLLIMDPPYNLSKNYHGHLFKEKEKGDYQNWFSLILNLIKPLLKPTATIYICSDWKTSILIAPILEKEFYIRNRITWERDKGRGAKTNWKNNTEDIWFCTVTDEYTFNVDAVKQKRKVIAPYRDQKGQPKDWSEEDSGNFRLTHPSNIWTDISIPFWSMPENTDHPTQKPEKLIAKLILASSNQGEMVFDPFLGSGTSAVVAKKLQRNFNGIEINQEYCCWALKRLQLAETDSSIQGYADGVFWERNSLAEQTKEKKSSSDKALEQVEQKELFK